MLGSDADWRRRDEFAGLDPARRERAGGLAARAGGAVAHALGGRPGARGDWGRALAAIDAPAPVPVRAACRRGPRPPPQALGSPTRPTRPTGRTQSGGQRLPPRRRRRAARRHGRAARRPRPLRSRPRRAAPLVRRTTARRPSPSPSANGAKADARAAATLGRVDRDGFAATGAVAIRRLAECVRQWPEQPTLRRQYAGCLYLVGRYEEAATQCEKAVAARPGPRRDVLLADVPPPAAPPGRRLREGLRPLQRPERPHPAAAPAGLALPGLAPDPGAVGTQAPAGVDGTGRRRPRPPRAGRPALGGGPPPARPRRVRPRRGPQPRRPRRPLPPRRARRPPGRADADADFVWLAEHPQADAHVRRNPFELYAFHRAVAALVRGAQRRGGRRLSTGARPHARSGSTSRRRSTPSPSPAPDGTDRPRRRRPLLRPPPPRLLDQPRPDRVQPWYLEESAFEAVRPSSATPFSSRIDRPPERESPGRPGLLPLGPKGEEARTAARRPCSGGAAGAGRWGRLGPSPGAPPGPAAGRFGGVPSLAVIVGP